MYVELARATSLPSWSTTSASTKFTRDPELIVVAVHVKTLPIGIGRRKLIFISAFALKILRSRAAVMLEAPIAESANAATKPPCIIPTGLQNRSSTVIVHTVTPGSSFFTQTMPSVRSHGGGTCTPGARGLTARAQRGRTPSRGPGAPVPPRSPADPYP